MTTLTLKKRIQNEIQYEIALRAAYAKSRSPRLRDMRLAAANRTKERIERLCRKLARMVVEVRHETN